MDIRTLVSDFAEQLTSVMQNQVFDRARRTVEKVLGRSGPGAARRGRPPKALALVAGKKPRKKAPKQLCPVPGCKNPAAPVFGMVCAKHKDLPKKKIKKYREARRAKKLKAA